MGWCGCFQDMFFDLIEKDDAMFGEGFSVTVKARNEGKEDRTVSVTLTARSVFYTGVPAAVIKKETYTVTAPTGAGRCAVNTVLVWCGTASQTVVRHQPNIECKLISCACWSMQQNVDWSIGTLSLQPPQGWFWKGGGGLCFTPLIQSHNNVVFPAAYAPLV